MSLRHFLLAFAVVAIWGTNFVVIKIGLRDFPPFFFALLRFFFCALPWLFFVPRPDVPWRWLAAFGALLGAGQFGLLFFAMRSDVTPGLASLVIQTQVFFTIGLSAVLFQERLRPSAVAGTALAAAGLAMIAWHLDATVTSRGIALVLGAAFFWACANLIVKKVAAESRQPVNMLAFMVWSSIFAVPPLAAMFLAFEGPQAGWSALSGSHADAWAALAWQVIGNTLFGYAAWGWLLARYEAATVVPWALLVPVIGIGSSAIALGEPLPAWKLEAATIVIAGLAVLTAAPLIARKRARKV